MSRIPDCRTDEAYNEKYLNELDKSEIKGYDWCTQMAVDNFFDNNFCHDDGSYLSHILAEKVPEELRKEYMMEQIGGEDVKREVITYADYIRYLILDWIELERNELITSMIDYMDDDEYEAIKEKVDGRTEKEVGQRTGENGKEAD